MTTAVVPPAWLRPALSAVRTATTSAALLTLLGLGAANMFVAPPSSHEDPAELGLSARPLDVLMERNRCSVTGFSSEVIPSKAIVRTPEGETKLVSFDHGWAVFSGTAAGDLVAVCLGPAQSRSDG